MAKKKTLSQRIAADPKLKAKYLSNPGLRSKLPTSALTPQQRKTRATNAYNNAPITPGSTVTNADLAREGDTAALVQFGGAGRELQDQQQREQAVGRDTAGWYDAYRKELQAHTANTQAMNAAAVGQIGALGNSMRGLDQTALTSQQTAANADAATRGATAANLGPDASNASLVRQQMIANFGAEQAGLGAAASRYADTRANVVAPTQQLQAQMGSAQRVRDVGKQITTLKEKAGAYDQSYRDTRKADEAKNVLAMKALDVNALNVTSDAAAAASRTSETVRHNKASETNAANASKARAQATASKINSYGYPASEWASMTTAARRKIIATSKGAGHGSKPPSGPGSLTPIKEQSLLSTVRKVQQRLDHPTKTTVDPTTGAKTRVPATPAEALNDLRGADVDPDAIIVAQSLKANRGKLDRKGVDAAHRLGIHVGGNYKIAKAPKATNTQGPARRGAGQTKGPATLRP